MFLVVSNSVGNVSSNHVITWKQQPITSFFDAHSAKVLFENKSSSPVILFWITYPLSKREWQSLRKQQHIVIWIFIFSPQTFTYKYTCWFWSTILFKKRGHLFFKSLYLLEIIIDRNSLQWADRIFDALLFIYYLIQKGRSQGSLLCFEWSISFKNLKVKKLNLKMHEIFKKFYSISCISQLTHFYLHQLLNLSNMY